MEFTSQDLFNAISTNNIECVAEWFEKLGLTKRGISTFFTSAHRQLVSDATSFASAMSYRGNLNTSMAKELIGRTAMVVNFFPFVRLIVASAGINTDDFDVIPDEIRTALLNNNYTDKIADAIEKLDDDAFAALLAFMLTGKVQRVKDKFNLPIIQRIHAGKTIPEHLVFAYMGVCLHDAVDEGFNLHLDALDALAALSALALLDNDEDD